MNADDAPKNKPIAIEKRKNLLYGSNKRRSVQAIVLLSLTALLAGLLLAFVIKGLGDFRMSDSRPIGGYALVQTYPAQTAVQRRAVTLIMNGPFLRASRDHS